jgi:xanthine dehydrogenase YagS FAD-binding subunit
MTLASGREDAMYLAGGTNLVDLMKLGVLRPTALVDVRDLPFGEIDHHDDGSVLIGATVRNSDLAGDHGIRERFPMLSQALLAGASGQLRSVATTGGNLLQRTRCVYFQDVTKPCNKRSPGSGCPAIEGHHRDLGLLGTSDHCVATNPSDMAVALVALDAVVHVRRVGGRTEHISVHDFYRLPGDTPHRETVLEHGDLVTHVEVPPPQARAVMRYRKVRDRASYAFAVVSVAVVASRDTDGRLAELKLGLGGLAPRPWRARRFEQALAGGPVTDDRLRVALAAEFATARPLPRNEFKLDLARDAVVATVRELTRGR